MPPLLLNDPRFATRTSGWWGRARARIGRRLVADGLEKLTLRWRFRAVVLVFGLPFLGYIVWSATEQAAIEKRHAYERARVQAGLIVERFEDRIDDTDRMLGAVAQAAEPLLDRPASLASLLRQYRAQVPAATGELAVWSVAGANLASLDPRTPAKAVNIADLASFRQALERLDLAMEGPLVSRTSGMYVLQFARPVLADDGRVIAVVTMTLRLEELVSLIDLDGRISDQNLITILDRDGTVVARSVDAATWIGKRAPSDAEALRRGFARQSGATERAGLDGRLRLSGFAVVNKLSWMIVVGEPVERAIAPVSERLFKGLAIGIAIFAIALLIAGRTASWTLVPLMRLALDADRFGAGDLAHRSSVTTGGEIAALAQNFNRMAEALQERDRAIAASQAQLRDITNNIPEQITYIDRDERYRFVNAYRGPLPMLSPETMLGRTVLDVRGTKLYGEIAGHLHGALGGAACRFDGTMTVDGIEHHYRCAYIPDRGPDGLVKGVYAFTQDVTEQRIAERSRIESERRLATITDNLPAMICYVDADRRFRFINRSCERWFKRPLAELIGQSFDAVLMPSTAAHYDRYFVRVLAGEHCRFETQVRTPGGRSIWLDCNFVPDIDAKDRSVRGLYGMMHDVTDARESQDRLRHLAERDTLTGLANRRQFNDVLAAALASDATVNDPLALMFLDIDHFKQVNDRHGHAIGDQLLREFAQRLSETVRPTDAVARLSGDEFVVLLRGLYSDEEPQFVARRIIAAVEKPFAIDGRVLQVGTSIGIAVRARVDESPSDLMRRADEALYAAKREGRNTFRSAS